MTEAQVQADVLRYLAGRRDCLVWRNNTGSVAGIVSRIVKALIAIGMRQAADAVQRIANDLGLHMSFGLPGSADVNVVLRGRFVAVECKSPTGTQSDLQRAYQSAVERHGGLYILARSAADVAAALETLP